jgi:hypothetical protein
VGIEDDAAGNGDGEAVGDEGDVQPDTDSAILTINNPMISAYFNLIAFPPEPMAGAGQILPCI